MRSFYAAHGREPLYPLATKISLRLLGDQDIAVSFTSMFFSVLSILGTFLLGYLAFWYWVGLGAAAAMAIEYDVVTWGVGGWRDDAFTAAVVFCTCAMLQIRTTWFCRRGSGTRSDCGHRVPRARYVALFSASRSRLGCDDCEGAVGGARKTRSAHGLDRRADRGSVFCELLANIRRPVPGDRHPYRRVSRDRRGERRNPQSVGGTVRHLEISLTAVAIGRYCGPRADRIPFHEQVVWVRPMAFQTGKTAVLVCGDRTVSICRFARRAVVAHRPRHFTRSLHGHVEVDSRLAFHAACVPVLLDRRGACDRDRRPRRAPSVAEGARIRDHAVDGCRLDCGGAHRRNGRVDHAANPAGCRGKGKSAPRRSRAGTGGRARCRFLRRRLGASGNGRQRHCPCD